MGLLRFKQFSKLPSIVHGISTAEYGNLSYKWAEANKQTIKDVRNNRQDFFKDLGINERHVVSTQVVGGKKFYDLDATDRGRGLDNPSEGIAGDGFFTTSPDTYLFVIVGDCLALFLFEPDKRVCGLVHCGWRGVDKEVPKLAVEYMVKKFDCDPAKIIVGLSPALQKESSLFEDFHEISPERLKAWKPYIKKIGQQYQADWVKFALDQLKSMGISPKNVENCAIDTRKDRRFYSHRRSEQEHLPEGRFGCLIGLQK